MNDYDMSVRVECYAGYRGEETPRFFFIGEREVEIVEIVDRWVTPHHRYFKVRDKDEEVTILRHDIVSERWEMPMFSSGVRQGTRDKNSF